LYQNEVDEQIKGVNSRDKMKQYEGSEAVIFRENDVGGRAKVMTDEERVLRGR